MNKIIKKERHKLYIEMLKEFNATITNSYRDIPTGDTDPYSFCKGFCIIIARLFAIGIINDGIHITDLPELMKHEPPKPYTYWFTVNRLSGTIKRREILEEAIKLTARKTKHNERSNKKTKT